MPCTVAEGIEYESVYIQTDGMVDARRYKIVRPNARHPDLTAHGETNYVPRDVILQSQDDLILSSLTTYDVVLDENPTTQ